MEHKVIKKPIDNKESFLYKIKKNWKNILLILLIIFSFSKCTSSCSRGKQIDRLNYQIEVRDSIIQANDIELEMTKTRLNDAQESNNAYKGIATGNQKELINRVDKLTEENKNLNNRINTLTKERDKLKDKVSELEKQIESTN